MNERNIQRDSDVTSESWCSSLRGSWTHNKQRLSPPTPLNCIALATTAVHTTRLSPNYRDLKSPIVMFWMYCTPKAFYQDLFYLHNRAWDLQRRKRSTELTLLAALFIYYFWHPRGGESKAKAVKKIETFGCIQLPAAFHYIVALTREFCFPEKTARSYRGITWITW